MRFGYVIVYVPDVRAAVGLFEDRSSFVHGIDYAEMETGATALAFCAYLPGGATASRFEPTAHVRRRLRDTRARPGVAILEDIL